MEQHLDLLREGLTSAIIQAATASIPLARLGPKSKPWWDESLYSLRTDMLHTQRVLQQNLAPTSIAEAYLWKKDYLLARNTYFQAIKTAKCDH